VDGVFKEAGLTCSIASDHTALQQIQLQKLLWASIFWMMSAGLGGKKVRRRQACRQQQQQHGGTPNYGLGCQQR
jgi:hypothetical protein